VTLALVAPSFDAVSETFIADHVRTLAPGRTVLVCRDSRGAERYGCPVLSHVAPEPVAFGPLDAALKRARHGLRRRFGPALGYDDRMRLMGFLRAHGVDRVLAEFGYSGALVSEVCAALDLPFYVYFRGLDASASATAGRMQRRYRRMFGHVRGVFCVSRHLAECVAGFGCPPELIHVNASGVQVDLFPPGDPDPHRALAVGRLVDKKAPHLTIAAFARIAGRFPAARLEMVGDGPLAGLCRETIARHGLEGRVTLLGALEHAEVGRLMRRASIFVQHSMTAANGDIEGFPTAIAEAMSSALAVVSTRHSGIPEHVRDGETGLLVEEGDVEGMAEALARTLADPCLARRLGAAARAHALAHLDRERARQRVRDVMGLPAPGPAPGPALVSGAGAGRWPAPSRSVSRP
jgi:glycosyltransferase involved in cell wall biosynthesis